jgi:uncharacterized membrane protein
MSRLQFWILVAASCFAVLLYLSQIFLLHSLARQKDLFAKDTQLVAVGSTNEAQWKQLARRVYELSRQDSTLADVLVRNQIAVHVNATATSVSTEPAPTPANFPVSTTPDSRPAPTSGTP